MKDITTKELRVRIEELNEEEHKATSRKERDACIMKWIELSFELGIDYIKKKANRDKERNFWIRYYYGEASEEELKSRGLNAYNNKKPIPVTKAESLVRSVPGLDVLSSLVEISKMKYEMVNLFIKEKFYDPPP